MKLRLLSIIIFIVYSILLIKVMVFKDVPPINIGVVTFDFAGTNGDNPPNFIPFMTIAPYLFGSKGLLIGGLNLIGNIIFLVPLGLLLPFIYKNNNWKKLLFIASTTSLTIEIMQVVLRVGIFDIDDVLLNALGFVIGYWVTKKLMQWIRLKKYKTIFTALGISTVITSTLTTVFIGDIFQQGQQAQGVRQAANAYQTNEVLVDRNTSTNVVDPCRGTGGNGQIVSIQKDAVIVKTKENSNLVVTYTDKIKVETSSGNKSISDLKIGDRITLVGDVLSVDSFAAQALVVCSSL